MKHNVAWHTAQPLWSLALADGGPSPQRFRAPALLRFAGDDFMAQLDAGLSRGSLASLVARPESWRAETCGWSEKPPQSGDAQLKLFQPAHYRFYLVAASLVCQLPGLPDRRIDAATRERASFVLRRLASKPGKAFDPRDPTSYDELAWFGGQQAGQWRHVARPQESPVGEERMPLCASRFTLEGQRRRLLCGLVPVGRRDVYEAGTALIDASPPQAELSGDRFSTPAAATAFQRIGVGLEQLAQPIPEASSASVEAALRSESRLSLLHVLLDLVEFLEAEVAPVWNAIERGSSAGLDAAGLALFNHLNRPAPGLSARFREVLKRTSELAVRASVENGSAGDATSGRVLGASLERAELASFAASLKSGEALHTVLVAALGDPRARSFQSRVGAKLNELDGGLSNQDAQDGLLMALLALSELLQAELPGLAAAILSEQPSGLLGPERAVYDLLVNSGVGEVAWRTLIANAEQHRAAILSGQVTRDIIVIGAGLTASQIGAAGGLAEPLGRALAAALAAAPMPSPAPKGNALLATREAEAAPSGWYLVRCVYERPACRAVHAAVISDPSEPFQLGTFFDPDAPVRPTRIQLPDVSLKALRRSPRGVTFALSKELRAQIDRARNAGLKGLSAGDIGGAATFDFGLVCSMSIPIITICAMILLMVIAQVLNIIFWWMPYFVLCLPRVSKGN